MALLTALLLQSKRVIQVAPTNIAVLDVAKKLVNQSLDDTELDRILVIVNDKRSNVKALIDDQLDRYVLSSRIKNLLTSVGLNILQFSSEITIESGENNDRKTWSLN